MAESKPVGPKPVGSPQGTSAEPSAACKPWNDVNQPGSYVCNDTGRLLRVPASGVKEGKTPVIEFLGPQGPAKVTRLSDDPALPVADLRLKATAASIKPQF